MKKKRELDMGDWLIFKLAFALPIMLALVIAAIIINNTFFTDIVNVINPLLVLFLTTGVIGITWGIPKEYLETNTKKKRKINNDH